MSMFQEVLGLCPDLVPLRIVKFLDPEDIAQGKVVKNYKMPLAPLKQEVIADMNNIFFYIIRSYSPAPRRHGGDYSVSPRRHDERPRSPRDHPQERDGGRIRRSYTPGYDDADDDQNHHAGNGYVE